VCPLDCNAAMASVIVRLVLIGCVRPCNNPLVHRGVVCFQRPPRARIDTSPAPPVYTSWKWTKSQELSKAIDGAHTHSTAEARCSRSKGVGGSTLTRRRHFHSTGELHERRVSVAGVDVGLGSAKDDSGAYGSLWLTVEGALCL
jgi:hypothetical protein